MRRIRNECQAFTRCLGYRREPHSELTPEEIFERRWAFTVIDRAMQRLQEDAERRGRLARFQRLKAFLTGAGSDSYRQAGSDLGMTEDAVKVEVHRRRPLQRNAPEGGRRDGRRSRPGDGEIRYLLEVIGRR